MVGSDRPLSVGELRTALVKAKAAKPTLTPVFDEAGKLVGMVDATDLIPIAPASPSKTPAQSMVANDQRAAASAGIPAGAVAPPGTDPDMAAAAEQVAKAFAGAQFSNGNITTVAKASGTLEQRYSALIRGLDAVHGEAVQNATAVAALRFVASGRPASTSAKLAKSIACDLGLVEQRKPSPAARQASLLASVKRVRQGAAR